MRVMTCELHPYPTQFIDVWRLRDGRRVTVRPILPQDAQPSQQFVRALSQRSRHRRFHAAVNELTPAMLERLTRVDHVRHLALVAERVEQHGTVLVGEARFVCADDPRRAEFAIAVADDWQGLGMGRRLLEALLHAAAARGVRHLAGDVMRDNRPMLALAVRLGFSFGSPPAEPGLVRVTIDPLAACADSDRTADQAAPGGRPRPTGFATGAAGRVVEKSIHLPGHSMFAAMTWISSFTGLAWPRSR